MFVFMGTNIMFWNCQGVKPKRKELEVYLNETFLTKKIDFKIQGYDAIKVIVHLVPEVELPSS